ncbi:MAG TPA: amino acid permease [Candidatus Acidoferrales bacterium]|jgi:APA family basic amino acid/polyamine antiporter|nr:amino acid permease [Candidatus Acidoferrales bacterium]
MEDTHEPIGLPAAHPSGELVKGLGLFDSTMIVVGSMIGSGIFIVSADIAHQVQGPGLLLVVWLASGLITLIGALSFGELAAAMPHAGGQYVYLRESCGPVFGFLYGWSMLLVIETATIAAVAIAFAKFSGVLAPWFSASHWIWEMGTFGPWNLWFGQLGPYNVGLNRQNLLAILSIILLTWINTRGLRLGKIVQNIFTVTKTISLAGLVLLGVFFSTAIARSANFTGFWRNAGWSTMHAYPPEGSTWMIGTLTLVGVAMVGSLFAMDAWNSVTFTAAEVKNPGRNLPLSLAFGTAIVVLLYTLANVAYLRILPLSGDLHGLTAIARGIEFASEGRVATAVSEVAFGPAGAIVMAVAILISTFGCNNGLILAGARIYYAMAKDGLFFRSVGTVNRNHVPAVALTAQCVWASVLCLSGTYGQLLDFLIFAQLLFYILTLGGLFILRWKRPEIPRPYRAIGYPILPGLYILMAVFLEIQLLRYKPQYTWPGLIIVLLGLPVYGLWKLAGKQPAES